jgi:farnesyl diphosphate synthase
LSARTKIFNTRLTEIAGKMEDVLASLLPEPDGLQTDIMKAMRYAALSGGKRLRPFLVIEVGRMLGHETQGHWQAAAALECMHVYSLIHDDLPCMDDDDVRRGRPTVHKAYGEAMAVLAGDALLTLAFEILARAETCIDAEVKLALIQELAFAGGTHGMIGGQVIDIKMEEEGAADITADVIDTLQSLKTGALIHFAVSAGGRIAGASADDLRNLSTYAEALGLAFQIRDDILDAEGSAEEMGKAVGKDAGLGKATFVSIHGLDGAKERAAVLGEQAKTALLPYGDKAHVLSSAVDFVLERKK